MRFIDPDSPNEALVNELIALMERSAARVAEIVKNPPGRSPDTLAMNQARATSLLSQINAEVARLKREGTSWTARAITDSVKSGLDEAQTQAEGLGVELTGSFDGLNMGPVHVIARETAADIAKAAEGMGKMASTGVLRLREAGLNVGEVNKILAGGVIEGRPTLAIRELRDYLRKAQGDGGNGSVTVPTRSGGTRTYDAGYFAKMTARTKMREASIVARHERFTANGIDLVKIIGRVSKNFCTAFLGRVYSLGPGRSEFPALASLPSGGPPFHPNCSKSTVPYIEGISYAPSGQARSEAA